MRLSHTHRHESKRGTSWKEEGVRGKGKEAESNRGVSVIQIDNAHV